MDTILAQVAATALTSAAMEYVEKIWKKWLPLGQSGEDDQIERMDRRMSLGLAKRDGKYVVAILVEKADSWAREKATAHRTRDPDSIVVEVTGKAYAANPDAPIRERPETKLGPGISIGHFRGSAGTLGGFVRVSRGNENWTGIIGSSHVLSMINTGERGEDVIQPGWPDGPRVFDNRMGKLETYTYLVHYQQKGDALNGEDIALVRPLEDEKVPKANLVPKPKDPDRNMRLKGCLPSERLFEHCGESVYKVGRTTGFTEGVLDVTNVPQYSVQLPNGRVYVFRDVAAVKNKNRRPFSRPGDSGSIVYTSGGQAIGTVLGASSTHSFMVPLSASLKTIRAELL